MKNVRLLYFSRASREMSLADLKDILETARSNNADLGVCGMLCYDKRYFLQALEGERSQVNELYLDIADDPRHDEITIISYSEIDKPLFSEWKMGYSGSSATFSKLLAKLGQHEFQPDAMSQKETLVFLHHMSKQQTEV